MAASLASVAALLSLLLSLLLLLSPSSAQSVLNVIAGDQYSVTQLGGVPALLTQTAPQASLFGAVDPTCSSCRAVSQIKSARSHLTLLEAAACLPEPT